ncbi:TIGR03086 family metal-binding protein [Streptomyces sp. NPDC048182]|uniref:TIGR03086 family metal-binding protein n=1 Tax=Streptomyces sp. NPDC048182 TaxID=3365507 RepID=UPI003718B9B9
MTKSISDLLRSATERTVPLVRGTADTALAAPTPCAEYDARALVAHLFDVVVNFQRLAAKEDAHFGQEPGPDRLAAEDWREAFAAECDALVAAWAVPGADQGSTGAMNMPAPVVGRMALGDLTVHGWDLARATGRPYDPDPAVVDALLGTFAELAPTARRMGVFGAEHPLPDGGADATPLDRLLALTGRDPRWTRP